MNIFSNEKYNIIAQNTLHELIVIFFTQSTIF